VLLVTAGAAPAQAADSTKLGTPTVTPLYGLKGKPPVPGAKAPKAVGPAALTYHYGTSYQFAVSQGTRGYVSIHKPTLAAGDFHTLVEFAAQSADGRQIVEIGSTVDRGLFGDSDPHLFVFHWVNGNPGCYNGCGFVPYSTTAKAGMKLTPGTRPYFTIMHHQGNWWLGYNAEWVGYFPDSLWGGTYTQTGLVQWFGEVAANSSAPCTDMGNGQFAASTTAASISGIGFISGPAVSVSTSATHAHYTSLRTSANSMRYGGPGAC
jgi:hypothetical protein